MDYVVVMLIGLACGGVSVFVVLDSRRKRVEREQAVLNDEWSRLHGEVLQYQARVQDLSTAQASFNSAVEQYNHANAEFNSRSVTYSDLQAENVVLKRDLRNLNIHLRKLKLDGEVAKEKQVTLDARIQDLGSRYLKENVKWIAASLNQNNFAACKQRLLSVIERCRGIDFDISKAEEDRLVADLKAEYELVVRAALEREEQSRIRAQIREEQQREKEIEREMKRLEREQEAIELALERALRNAENEYSEEVERLRARLAEAEANKQRAISQAQLTKSGYVYVISNIGSFGEGIFKIGMTRRLEPLDRVRELGDASVPFPFDVHMMVSAENAPALENALHRAFHKTRLNKTNPRKEYFRASIIEIANVVRQNHGEVDYVADAEALQYRQSVAMSDEDLEFIEDVFEKYDDEDDSVAVED
jgi:hypothetical protein